MICLTYHFAFSFGDRNIWLRFLYFKVTSLAASAFCIQNISKEMSKTVESRFIICKYLYISPSTTKVSLQLEPFHEISGFSQVGKMEN